MVPQLPSGSPACVSYQWPLLCSWSSHPLLPAFLSVPSKEHPFSFTQILLILQESARPLSLNIFPSAPSSFFSSHDTNGLTRVLQLLSVSIWSALGLARNVGGDMPNSAES